MKWDKWLGWTLLLSVSIVWVWLIASGKATETALPLADRTKNDSSITLNFQCYVITTNDEQIRMKTQCTPASGAIMLEAAVKIEKDVTLRHVIIKDSHGVYEEIFDLESIFGDDPIMKGHHFKKDERYGFGPLPLRLYSKRVGPYESLPFTPPNDLLTN